MIYFYFIYVFIYFYHFLSKCIIEPYINKDIKYFINCIYIYKYILTLYYNHHTHAYKR